MKFLVFSTLLAVSFAANASGAPFNVGPWRLGMVPAKVQSFGKFGPYTPIEPTGGLETVNASFQGQKTKVSFAFDASGLKTIKIWKYQGASSTAAQAAVIDLFHLFSAKYGGAKVENVNISGPNGSALTEDTLKAVLKRILGTAKEMTASFRKKGHFDTLIIFDMRPNQQPLREQLDAQWGYNSKTDKFFAILYEDRAGVPIRRAKANLQTVH
ncbi:MAG: hypothetical protein ACRD22_08775 [Terriglobia bacterium]